MLHCRHSLAATALNFTDVLISRPAADNQRLAADLRAAGFRPLPMPAFEFRATAAKLPVDLAWQSAASLLVVFTSPRAVQFGLEVLPEGMLEAARVAAVGPATQAALEGRGQSVDLVPDDRFDSEGLLALPALGEAPGMAVILNAPGGRTLLQETLAERGWEVHVLQVYERLALAPDAATVEALLASRSLLSAWTSVAALDTLLARLPDAARARILAAPMLVISGRLADVARQRGAQRVHCADGPGNGAIVAAARRIVAQDTAGPG